MTAVAELLGPDTASRLAALKADLGQRHQRPLDSPVAGGIEHEDQGAAPVNATPRVTQRGQASEPATAPVCGACGQPVPTVEKPLPGCTAAPAVVFRDGGEGR